MYENTSTTVMLVVVIIGIVIIAINVKECTLEEQKMYLEKGYCRQTIDGITRWAKCKE